LAVRRVPVVCVALLFSVACTAAHPTPLAEASGSTTSTPSTSVASTTTVPPAALVPWIGPVEHLFFHTLVVRPELAFQRDALGRGFRDYFVTVGEFRAILDQLYANGWTLVDIHHAIVGDVQVPEGRKPFVLSEDDVNYYDYSRPRGQAWRLVLDTSGDVKVEVRDDLGTRITDDDLVPIVDEFVTAHPDFSADGAKGVLGLTGYEGLFGERVNRPSDPDFEGSAERVSALGARLRATGWTLATHSYGHIDLSKVSTARVQRDTDQWKAEAEPLIGSTDVYIYPFGANPGLATTNALKAAGYSIQCNIDSTPRLVQRDGASIMSRRHIDGIAFAQQARHLAPLFDVDAVEDHDARGT
jgi:hypothetical protein